MKLLVLTFLISTSSFALIKQHGTIDAIDKHIQKRIEKAQKAYDEQKLRFKHNKECHASYKDVFSKLEDNLDKSYEKLTIELIKIRGELVNELEAPLAELDKLYDQAKNTKTKIDKLEYKVEKNDVRKLQREISVKISEKFNKVNEDFVTMNGMLNIPLRRTHKVDRKNTECNLDEGELVCEISGSYRNQLGSKVDNAKTIYRRKLTEKEVKKVQNSGSNKNTINDIGRKDAINYHKDTAGNLFDICKTDKYPKGTSDCIYLVGAEYRNWAKASDITNIVGGVPLTKGLYIDAKRFNATELNVRINQIENTTAEGLPMGGIPMPEKCLPKNRERKKNIFNKVRSWFSKDKEEGETNNSDSDGSSEASDQ